MAFDLTPVLGQQHEEVGTGRRWRYDVGRWIPDEIDVLDDLDDVATLSNLTAGALSTLLTTTAGGSPTTVDMFTTTYANPRQSVTFDSYVELESLTVALDYDITGTSGLLKVEVYKGQNTTVDNSSTNFASVVSSLGSPVLTSYSIEAITAQGAAVFTFPPNNILSPGLTYTFVIRSSNLDAPMLLTVVADTITGQFGNSATQDINFFFDGYVLSGTPAVGDVLKFDTAGGSVWKSEAAYSTGAFDPIQINTRDPLVTDVFNAGIFWRNEITERVWISRGAGLWWPIPPSYPYVVSPLVATRSDTAPTGPVDGQLWFANTLAKLFLWDADAAAWIEV